MAMEDAAKVATPELDKQAKVVDKSQTCGEFLEWLRDEKGFVLARYPSAEEAEEEGLSEQRPLHVHTSTTELLAEFFEIDLRKIEAERRALLEAIRA